MCDFVDVHEYIEKELGRPVYTHELADKNVWEEIKEKSKEDFLELCKREDPERKEDRWIPTSKKLPEDDTVVLVCGKSGGVYTAIHNNSKTWIRGWWKLNSKNHHCNPIAWQPLPDPYREERREE